MKKTALPFIIAIPAIIASPHLARAASINDATTVPLASDDASMLQEVVVTARRREESLQRVPIAVTAVSGQEMEAQGIHSIEDLANAVPTLSISAQNINSSTQLNFAMRGESEVFGATTSPAVATYFAEVPFSAVGPEMFFDLKDVQVLRGPQGTLFGKNTNGGAVLFDPVQPNNQFGGYVEARMGNYGLAASTGVINVPIVSGKLMIRFAYDVVHRDGYTHDLTTGKYLDDDNHQAFRLGITYNPTDTVTNYLVFNTFNSNTNGESATTLAVSPLSAVYPAVEPYYVQQQHLGPRVTWSPSAALDPFVVGLSPFAKVRDSLLVDDLQWQVNENLSFKNIAGYYSTWRAEDVNVQSSPLPVLFLPGLDPANGAALPYDNERQISEEVRLYWQKGSSDLTVGAYYQNLAPQGVEVYSGTALDPALTFGFSTPYMELNSFWTKSYAVYANGDYDLGGILPGLKLTGGIRNTWDSIENKAATFYEAGQLAQPGFKPIPGDCIAPSFNLNDICDKVTTNVDFSGLTWLGGLSYQINPASMVYVTARRGYMSGGVNGFAGVGATQTYNPQYNTEIEVGDKTDFHIADMPTRLDVALYHDSLNGLQRSLVSNAVHSYIANAGSATVQGIEVEATIKSANGLTFSGFGDYTDAYYTRYDLKLAQCLADEPGCVGGLATLTPAQADSIAFSMAPRWKAGMTGTYVLPFDSALGDVMLTANYTYQSWTTQANDPQWLDLYTRVPGYGLLNLRMDWQHVGGSPLDLAIFANNALNHTYLDMTSVIWSGFGMQIGHYGPPAMYGAEVKVHF